MNCMYTKSVTLFWKLTIKKNKKEIKLSAFVFCVRDAYVSVPIVNGIHIIYIVGTYVMSGILAMTSPSKIT